VIKRYYSATLKLSILWLFFCWLLLNFYSNAQADVITAYGLEQGDQTEAQMHYHAGMQAYLASDYDSAFRDWRKAAENNHAKAAFNLGWMWHKGQVPSFDVDNMKAQQYFLKAYNLGYVPAQKYLSESNLALPKSQASDVKAETQIAETQSVDSQVNRSSIQGKLTGSTDIPKDNAWLNSYSDSDWVLQVFATQNELLLRDMVSLESLDGNVNILVEEINNEIWFKLLYGKYNSRESALNAITTLPEAFQEEKPWVREIIAIKKSLKS